MAETRLNGIWRQALDAFPERGALPLLAGNVIFAGANWLMVPWLVWFYGDGAAGAYAWGLATALPVFAIANLALRQAVATDAKHLHSFNDYLGTRLAALAVVLPLTAVLIAGADAETRFAGWGFLIARAGDSLNDIAYGAFQRRHRPAWIGQSFAARAIATWGCFAAVLALGGGVGLALVGVGFANAAVFFALDAPRARRLEGPLRPPWRPVAWGRIATEALPLTVGAAAWQWGQGMPRWALEKADGAEALGTFTALLQLSLVLWLVMDALAQTAQPRLAEHWAAGNRRAFRKETTRLVLAAAVLIMAGAVGVSVAGGWVLGWIYGPAYAGRQPLWLFITICFAPCFFANAFGAAILASRRWRILVWTNLAGAAAAAAVAVYAVPLWSSRGAALSLGAGGGVAAILCAWVVISSLSALPAAPPDPK